MNNSQKGSVTPYVILVVLAILVAGGYFYYLIRSNSPQNIDRQSTIQVLNVLDTQPTSNNPVLSDEITTTSPISDWQIYNGITFTIKYPKGWRIGLSASAPATLQSVESGGEGTTFESNTSHGGNFSVRVLPNKIDLNHGVQNVATLDSLRAIYATYQKNVGSLGAGNGQVSDVLIDGTNGVMFMYINEKVSQASTLELSFVKNGYIYRLRAQQPVSSDQESLFRAFYQSFRFANNNTATKPPVINVIKP